MLEPRLAVTVAVGHADRLEITVDLEQTGSDSSCMTCCRLEITVDLEQTGSDGSCMTGRR